MRSVIGVNGVNANKCISEFGNKFCCNLSYADLKYCAVLMLQNFWFG